MGKQPGWADCSALRPRGGGAETMGTGSELWLTPLKNFTFAPLPEPSAMCGAEARRAQPLGLCLAAAVPGRVERAVCLQPAVSSPRSAGCPSPRKDPKAPACLHAAPARRSPARCQVAPRGSAPHPARLNPHSAWDLEAAPREQGGRPAQKDTESP